MGNELLIRSYNVGCGDCIYVCIPDDKDGFHILIDCGTKDKSPEALKQSVKHIEDNLLPSIPNSTQKRLDLVVVTHRHEDHIKGFDPKYFQNIVIRHMWVTVAMDENHPQAQRSLALHAFAQKEVMSLAGSGKFLSPELKGLTELYSISNTGATDAVTKGELGAKKIKPKFVYAGKTSKSMRVAIPDTLITVLGPERDIDGYYLGKDADQNLRGLQSARTRFQSDATVRTTDKPTNISSLEFRRLQNRILSNGLGFVLDDTNLQNNVSVVLLLEWKGRRLLFTGDAEWEPEYREGKKNGSWNVMWEKRRTHLKKPLDFLKVGHHGSLNATPWDPAIGENEGVNEILNAILPLPTGNKKPTAQCIVSTKRTPYETIPDGTVLTELGKRVSNTEMYLTKLKQRDPGFKAERDIFRYSFMKEYSSPPSPKEVGDKGWLDKPQPQRTDLESHNYGSETWNKKVAFVDVKIKPK